jgi:hypothetical protein
MEETVLDSSIVCHPQVTEHFNNTSSILTFLFRIEIFMGLCLEDF